MAGYQLCIDRNLFDQHSDVVDHSLYAAAAIDIYKRESSDKEIVSEMHGVRILKEHDRVAVGVAVGKMDKTNFFAVDVQRHAFGVSDDGQSKGLIGRGLLSENYRRIEQALPNIYVRDDRRIFAEILISLGVIAVPVSIEHEPRFLRSEFF